MLSNKSPGVDSIESTSLNDKISSIFGRLSMDKRRLPSSGLVKAGIPSYVAEWILEERVPGSGMLTNQEMELLHSFINKAIPGKNEKDLYKNRLLNGESVKLLSYMNVGIDINRKKRDRFAVIPILGLSDCLIPSSIIEENPDLLRQGMWGIVCLTLINEGILVEAFKPMQAKVDLESFYRMRNKFSTDEWRYLMLQSAGYNPWAYSDLEQIWILSRLLPIVQKNLHLIELSPKGTGKSFIFENISSRVKIVSGGNISPAVMFYNNATGQEGLLARYDVLTLDEVQKIKFDKPEEIIGSLKGYLANNRITRGGKVTLSSDCGLVLLANILLDETQQPYSELLVEELQNYWHESALLDRFNGIIPGWEVNKFAEKMIAKGIGLKADFFSDTLTAMRNDNRFDDFARRHLKFGDDVKIRDQKAVVSNVAGFLKILFPDCKMPKTEFDSYCLQPAKRMRQLIRDQLWILDPEFRQTSKLIEVTSVNF